jgi:hypothetical protein
MGSEQRLGWSYCPLLSLKTSWTVVLDTFYVLVIAVGQLATWSR